MLFPVWLLSCLLVLGATQVYAKPAKSAGKVFAPSNYTAVGGFFIQNSPSFNATGYNLLNGEYLPGTEGVLRCDRPDSQNRHCRLVRTYRQVRGSLDEVHEAH